MGVRFRVSLCVTDVVSGFLGTISVLTSGGSFLSTGDSVFTEDESLVSGGLSVVRRFTSLETRVLIWDEMSSSPVEKSSDVSLSSVSSRISSISSSSSS